MEEKKDDKVYLLFDGFKTRIGYTPASDSYWMSIASDNNLYREMVYEFQRYTGIPLDDLAKSYGSHCKGMTYYFKRRCNVEWFIEAIRTLYLDNCKLFQVYKGKVCVHDGKWYLFFPKNILSILEATIYNYTKKSLIEHAKECGSSDLFEGFPLFKTHQSLVMYKNILNSIHQSLSAWKSADCSCFDDPSVLYFIGDNGLIKGMIDVGNKPDNKTEKKGKKIWKGNLPEGRKLRSGYCRGRIVRGEVAEK